MAGKPAQLAAHRAAWQAKVTAVAIRLLEAFALALEQPRDAFAPIYGDTPNHRMKIVRYPGRHGTIGDQGVGAHKDGGFLTLLLQDENKGLQIDYDGSWIEADPIPDTFVVNIGELLELASNGYLRATVHRVVTPRVGAERYSIPFFFGARLDAEVPLLELPPKLAAEARGPASDPANPLFRNVGTNVLKSRLRSHPDVAQRHYADLLEFSCGLRTASAPETASRALVEEQGQRADRRANPENSLGIALDPEEMRFAAEAPWRASSDRTCRAGSSAYFRP